MNPIKFIFIFFILTLLHGQAISTPKNIKPLVELEPFDEQTLVTFIGLEGPESYKTAKLYNITKNNVIFERKDIFELTLSKESASFFSGGHLADITGEGVKELILLITNPQLGTQIISFSIKPGLKFKRLHDPYFIKSKQKASEALSSETALIYEDKDQEIIICFGSPERKVVIVDYQGDLKTKTIAKKFLENNVGPILLRTNDFNNDGLFDLYILSNGKKKEERIYFAPQFNSTETKELTTKETVQDVYFLFLDKPTPTKIMLLKNNTLYIEEWNKTLRTEEQNLKQIIGHSAETLFVKDNKGNILKFKINTNKKEINNIEKISADFIQTNFSKTEHLKLKNNKILITHNNKAELVILNLNDKQEEKKPQETQKEEIKNKKNPRDQ